MNTGVASKCRTRTHICADARRFAAGEPVKRAEVTSGYGKPLRASAISGRRGRLENRRAEIGGRALITD